MEIYDIRVLKVTKNTHAGVTLALDEVKEALIPLSEQTREMSVGKEYTVMIWHEAQTDRYFASENIEGNIELTVEPGIFKVGEEVEAIVYRFSPLGANVVINFAFKGMIYQNEIFAKLNIGDKVKAYIKTIRGDGKIDLSLQKLAFKDALNQSMDKVMSELTKADGFLPLTDDSSPEAIKETFQLSKKAFKRAVGALYKQQKITLGKDGIHIIVS